MLPRHLRLPAQIIPVVAKQGKQIFSSDLFHIKLLTDSTASLWAISVGLKVSKKAVVRNRIKRLFRAAIISVDQISDSTPPNGKYLIVARSAAITDMTSVQLTEILKSCLSLS